MTEDADVPTVVEAVIDDVGIFGEAPAQCAGGLDPAGCNLPSGRSSGGEFLTSDSSR